MLSDKILEELVRRTPMSEHLVTEAWPDLSTESRLQIIQEIVDANLGFLPTWLAVLAMNDRAPIVRYWAARSTYFKEPESEGSTNATQALFGFLNASTAEEKRLYATAKADSSQLVQAGIDKSYRTLTDSTQLRRLTVLRSQSMPHLAEFFGWLDAAIDAGVSDRELSECAQEFLALPKVNEELRRDPTDFEDGLNAYSAGKVFETAWRVAKKAGASLQRWLASNIPTRMGLWKLDVDELAQMPDEVLAELPWRKDNSEEVAAVLALMRDNPGRFPDKAIEALNRAGNSQIWSAEQLVHAKARQAVDRSPAIIETLINLDGKLTALNEQLHVVLTQSSRKRGFFR
ncbi:hypothetical protein AYM40_37800 (plasmid) [Paraburkholderia phytofirmans OLGA172]|uniref:Uncharacterized protein n=1 Tax=Paraburkholderia phytofirmans OLGA172 TaxID=1417228 RepID=A0A167WSR4_9BURK|nr:hypothetical protein [Paraburkholderia phytofirmans]ANB78123.1 hypothetical protein AYM40_37800 [Paraburkholderia phytofirmans OLGA172]